MIMVDDGAIWGGEEDAMGSDGHIDMEGVTAFQERVYRAACAIPRGRVTTYGRLARSIGCGSAQAVGQALRRNPFAPEVPCHRVIAADRSLGGFDGSRGEEALARKRERLLAEGVRMHGDVVEAECLV